MNISAATLSDLEAATETLSAAFAQDQITGFLLQNSEGYKDRLQQFFTLLMRARIALKMPVLTAVEADVVCGAAMGYTTARPDWPDDVTADWDLFEKSVPGFADRMAVYDGIAESFVPSVPHYYLGVIGVSPQKQGSGVGAKLLSAFCELSANDPLSSGVYLETATPSNVGFYEQAGFAEIGRGALGDATLWCMYLSHGSR